MPGRPTHDPIYTALRDLHADYARLQPWYPYPRMAVAELKPPENGKTYWDFSLMDQYTADFMQATAGHPVVFDFGTLPAWMFKTPAAVPYPEDPTPSHGITRREPSFATPPSRRRRTTRLGWPAGIHKEALPTSWASGTRPATTTRLPTGRF